MVFFKHFEIELLKVGKVSSHSTKAKIKEEKKVYQKGKVYLNDSTYINKQFELYGIGEVGIQEVFSNIKGKGIMIFFPKKVRKKQLLVKEDNV